MALTKEQRRKWSLIGGIAGFVTGFYLIFILNNKWGFVPAIMGAILLLTRRNHGR